MTTPTIEEIQVEVDAEVFNAVYIPHLNNFTRTQIFFGGSSSGKSVFLAQRCVIDVMAGGRNYLVCRQVGNTLRKSVFNEIKKVIADFGVGELFDIHKTELVITCTNGYQIIFAGLDDVEKLKSITPAKGAITDIWIEEATETEKAAIKQLYKRQRGGDAGTPKRLTLSFNPILQSSWIYMDYFSTVAWADDQTYYVNDTLSILKTTYKDNKFLTPDDIADLEGETDKYYYDVYTLGKWGVLGYVIFTNWIVADLSDPQNEYYLPLEQRTNPRNGQDFGFSSDPAALFVSHYDRSRKRIYVCDELYERGLTNDVLAVEIKKKIGHWHTDEKTGENVCTGTQPVTCDSAEPKSIQELRAAGVDARGAKKGKDSVNFGIQWMQQQTIIIDVRCVHARNEVSTYHWKEDKDGNAIRQPVEKNNHLIDGGRYAYEDDMIDMTVEVTENPFFQ